MNHSLITLNVIINKSIELTRQNEDIKAVLLVGSYARNRQNNTSDIDLIILTEKWENYVNSSDWIGMYGEIEESQIEHYGLITSIRAFYKEYEIEFGLGSLEWIKEPIDQGTEKVLRDGYKIIYEKYCALKHIKEAIAPIQP
jgi:predicted nucleotidyltransferase